MLDGFYQSVICWFMAYLVFRPGQSATENGLDISDRLRMGVFVAASAVVVSNVYILLNTFRWDWLTVLINVISSLLVWFWTGVYSATEVSGQFYQAGAQVFGTLNFWLCTLLTIIICLTPRFTAKSLQKIYRPRDIDIIREQIRMGMFKYLDNYEAYIPPDAGQRPPPMSASSSDLTKSVEVVPVKHDGPDDERPIYPPSMAPTTRTRNRGTNGSDGTGYTASLDFGQPRHQSVDRVRSSWDRGRTSMDRVRASFEGTNEFTSAAMLSRMESSHRPTDTRN